MAANNDLFELIKTLSKSEKRYFTMTASLHSRSRVNRYVRLFEMIDAQEIHDDDAVREEFTNRFGTKHFAEAKYYLYNAILRALHAYAGDRSIDARLSMAIHQAEILYERKLYRQCGKLLERTREQAVEMGQWDHAARAAELEIRLRKFNGASEREEIERLIDERERAGEAWIEETRRSTTFSRLELLATLTGPPRDPEGLAAYWDLFEGKGNGAAPGAAATATETAPPASATAAYHHLNSLGICQHAAMDFRAALASYRSILDIVNSGMMKPPPNHVMRVMAVFQVCVYSIYACDPDTFFDHYPLLLEQTEKSPGSIRYSFHIHALALLPNLYALMGEFERAREELRAVEDALESYGPWRGIGLDSTVARVSLWVHFGIGDYARCIDLLNELLAMRSQGLPEHLYTHMRLIQIIVHYERGDFDLLESLLRSTHRYVLSIRNGSCWERALLDVLRRGLRSRTESERLALLSALLEDLGSLRDSPFGYIFQETVDIPLWIESKIERRSFAEMSRALFAARSNATAPVG